MKRINPSSGKKTHVPSDFKRLKAKVGKRAPQKLNATDTKFSTATINVQSQSVAADTSAKHGSGSIHSLTSTKGKHFSQLMAQLNHPAANARSSALQGMKDAILHTSPETIPQHLALIVPSLASRFVDEDSTVRKSSMSILFQDVSRRLIDNVNKNNMGDRMRPFLPLLLAYIGSALHSLDVDIRYDGCHALESLCRFHGDLFIDSKGGGNANGNGRTGEGKDGVALLQDTLSAFTVLLDDVSGGASSIPSSRGMGTLEAAKRMKDASDDKNSNNKRKKTKGKKKDKSLRGVAVLQSFVAVLGITSSSQPKDQSILKEGIKSDGDGSVGVLKDKVVTMMSNYKKALIPSANEPDFTFLPGGRISNAITWNRNGDDKCGRQNRNVRNLGGLRDLQKIITRHQCTNSSTISKHFTSSDNTSLDLTLQSCLLTKLRDRFVEITLRGHSSGDGLYLSPNDVNECELVVNAVRLLWNGYSCQAIESAGSHALVGNEKEELSAKLKKIKAPGNSILNLVLDNFPIQDTSGNKGHQQKYDVLNSSLCMALSELGNVFDNQQVNSDAANEGQTSKWVESIFNYVVPQLESYAQGEDASKSFTRYTLLEVIEQLLLRHPSRSYSTLDSKSYIQLLNCFGKAYFPKSGLDGSVCKTGEGRRASYLLTSLITQHLTGDVQLGDSIDLSLEASLLQMSSVLVEYLVKWRGNYPNNSTVVLATLFGISRRYNVDGQENRDDEKLRAFCTSLRSSIGRLFVTSNKLRKISLSSCTSKLSVFEELPEVAQRIAMSLIGILRFPSEKLVSSLAQICCRRCRTKNGAESNVLSNEMIDYILGVVQTLSRTISLQQYLTFLVHSCGIHSARYDPITNDSPEVDEQNEEENNSLRDSLVFVTSYDYAIARTCRYICQSRSTKILQMLTPVLASWLAWNDSDALAVKMLKARAATAVLSCQVLLFQSKDVVTTSTLTPDLQKRVVEAVSNFFLCLPIGGTESVEETTNYEQVISPIMVSSLQSVQSRFIQHNLRSISYRNFESLSHRH